MEARTSKFLKEAGGAVVNYARGQIIVSAILSVLYAIGFGLIGVPFWPILAVVCGFLNLIPYIGGVIAVLLAVGSVLMVELDWYRALAVLAVYVVVQLLEGIFITPRVLGKAFDIRPLYLFLLLLAAGAIAGPIGMVLAVPVFVIARIALKHYRKPARNDTY